MCVLFVFMSVFLFICAGAEDSEDDIIEKILQEKQYQAPHELFGKPKRALGATKGSVQQDFASSKQLEHAREELEECKKKRGEILEELVKSAIKDSSSESAEKPYLKMIYRAILSNAPEICDEKEHFKTVHFKVHNSDISTIRKCLKEEKTTQECVEFIITKINTGQVVAPSKWLPKLFKLMEKINLEYLGYCLIGLSACSMAFYFAFKLITNERTFLGTTLLLFVLALSVSVPWEWMRMYKKELAKKSVKMKALPAECSNQLSYTSMLKLWMLNAFTFSDDPCLEYYDAIIVDPLWEVTPGQALSASVTRIFLQPTLHIADHIGKCFRLIFKDIPVQWQLIVFVVIMLFLFFAIGIEFYTPLLRIGLTNNQNYALEAKTKRIKELEALNATLQNDVDRSKQQLQAINQKPHEIPENATNQRNQLDIQDSDDSVFIADQKHGIEEVNQTERVVDNNRRISQSSKIASESSFDDYKMPTSFGKVGTASSNLPCQETSKHS